MQIIAGNEWRLSNASRWRIFRGSFLEEYSLACTIGCGYGYCGVYVFGIRIAKLYFVIIILICYVITYIYISFRY